MPTDQREANDRIRRNVLNDLEDRGVWAKKQDEIARRRLSARRTKKSKPYPGAPNFVEPIIDDNVREKTDQEISMLLNAPVMAHVLPLSAPLTPDERSNLEHAFDTYLRHIVTVRPRLEEGLDMKNSRGFTVYKVVRSKNNRLKRDLPVPLVLDGKDVIVPEDTKEVQESERIVHVLRLTSMGLRTMVRENGWSTKAAEKIIEDVKTSDTSDSGSDEESIHEVTKDLVGLATSDTEEGPEGDRRIKNIVIWEVYRYADEDDEARDSDLIADRKMVTVFCPDVTDSTIAEFPWREKDSTEEMDELSRTEEALKAVEESREPVYTYTVIGEDKVWPFVQNRYENRSGFWYDSRGIGELVMDNQIKATQTQNVKSTLMDYYGNPLYTGDMRNSGNVSFRPGSKLPQGFAWVQPPQISQQFDFDINNDRATASKRAGSGSQNLFSSQASRGNAVEKTAAEVKTEDARVNMVSSASVDRFNTPMGELFQLIWQDLKRLQPTLPIFSGNERVGELESNLYDLDVLWVPASSAKTLNPEIQLQRSMGAAQFALSMIETGLTVDPDAIWDTVSSYWDPNLTRGWVIDPEEAGPQGQAPIYKQLGALQQAIQNIAQAMQEMGGNLEASLKLAQENADRNDKQEEAIAANTERISDFADRIARQLQSMNDKIRTQRSSQNAVQAN